MDNEPLSLDLLQRDRISASGRPRTVNRTRVCPNARFDHKRGRDNQTLDVGEDGFQIRFFFELFLKTLLQLLSVSMMNVVLINDVDAFGIQGCQSGRVLGIERLFPFPKQDL